MLLLFIILAASSVSSAPFLEKVGSTFIGLDTNHRRAQVTSVFGPRRDPYSIKRDNTDSLKQDFQGMARVPPKDQMDAGAFRRKQVWENAIQKENRLYPDQVLPVDQDVLKRSQCNALPFIQNVVRKNCVPLRIPNKFCFGQCNSFYVPGWPPGIPQPCTSCTPAISRRVMVPLHCRGGRVSWEQVVLVEECDCETSYDWEDSQVGSGEGLLPVY